MNAQSPIAAEATDVLTESAISNPEILRALAAGAFATTADLAQASGTPMKNIVRTLERMKRDGLIAADPWTLTPAGRLAWDAIRLSRGELAVGGEADPENDVLLIAHHHLRPNRAQPRQRDWDSPEERERTEQLAATIYETGEVLHNLVVFPADDQGDHDIADGERRWRAVGLLIEQGLWPTDRRLKAVPRQRGAGDVAFLALVANGSRDGLTMFEQAKAYRDLIAEKGWSAREAALKTGRDVRTVQEMAKVWRDATPEDLAEFEAGTMTWERIRDSVKESRATAPEPEQGDIEEIAPVMTPAMQLGLIELGWKVNTDPFIAHGGEPSAHTNGYSYMSDTWKGLKAAGMIEEAMPRVWGRPCCLSWPTYKGWAWLDERFADSPLDLAAVEAAREDIGRQDKAPGAGEDTGFYTYVLNDAIGEGMLERARQVWEEPTPLQIVRLIEVGHKIATTPDWTKGKTLEPGHDRAIYEPENNHDPAFSGFSFADIIRTSYERGRRMVRWTEQAQALVQRLGFNGVNAGSVRQAWKNAGLEGDGGESADSPLRYKTEWLNPGADPLVVDGVRFPNITLANQARFARDGGAPSNSGGGSKKPAAFDAASLNPHQRLGLIEIDHKHTAEGEGDWVKVRDYWLDQSFADISGLKLVGVTHAHAGGPHSGLTQAGRDALTALGLTPGGITAANLDAARIACGQAAWPASQGYVSPWLNVPAGEAAAPTLQADPEREADADAARLDADEEADEALLDDLIGRLRERFAKTLGGDERWNRLTVTGLASAACIAVQQGQIVPAIEALAALLKRESDYRGGAILRDAVFGSGLDRTPERDTSDDDPLLFALRSGDVVSVGGAASGYRLLEVEDRRTGAYPVEGLAFRAQQVSLKTGRDVGQPRQVTLHAIQGLVADQALEAASAKADA